MHLVGEGKFSKVWACINEQDKLKYAIKIINKKKLNRIFRFSRRNALDFLTTEITILRKLVRIIR